MLCERYKVREAAIKYTKIVNGVKTEHNLCSHCVKETNFGQYSTLLDGEFPSRKLLSGLLSLEDDEEETDMRGNVVCPACGISFEDFVESSRFGCASCYGVFDLSIKDKIKQSQGSESHKGEHPKYRSTFEKEHLEAPRGPGEETKENTDCLAEAGPQDFQIAVAGKQIRELDSKLEEATRQGDYELVVGYRDQIKELRKEAGIHGQVV